MLNDGQRRAVHVLGHALVSACPGSGKTTVLAERAAHLLSAHPGEKLAAVTFTNDAAEELAHRVKKSAPRVASRVQAGTFHRLAKDQLVRAGIKVRIANDHQAADFVRRAIASTGAALTVEVAKAEIEAIKVSMRPPARGGDEVVAAIYAEYVRLLTRSGMRDFQDLVVDAVRGMQDGSVKPLDARFILVDEFQDTDEAQLAWIMAHVHAGAEITAVGDDDQCIYGFRHALGFQGMRRFLEETHATHIQLDITYRCAPEILASAGRLISQNTERVPKTLRTARSRGGSVSLVHAEDRETEAVEIAKRIATSPKGWAVLTRTNHLLDGVEATLTTFGIPYTRMDGRSYWDSPGPALFLGAAHAIASRDLHGIERVLGACGVSGELLERLHVGSARERFGRFVGGSVEGDGAEGDVVRDLARATHEWLELLRTQRINLALYGLADWLESHVQKRYQPASHPHSAKALARMSGTLSQRLAGVTRAKETRAGDGAVLMTLHSAKGLEFDQVWLAHCEQGILPHKDGTVEEERRLMYVGMTRARHELVLSSALGSRKHTPSVFLEDSGVMAAVGIAG